MHTCSKAPTPDWRTQSRRGPQRVGGKVIRLRIRGRDSPHAENGMASFSFPDYSLTPRAGFNHSGVVCLALFSSVISYLFFSWMLIPSVHSECCLDINKNSSSCCKVHWYISEENWVRYKVSSPGTRNSYPQTGIRPCAWGIKGRDQGSFGSLPLSDGQQPWQQGGEGMWAVGAPFHKVAKRWRFSGTCEASENSVWVCVHVCAGARGERSEKTRKPL